jgi:hypothetical protein
MIPGFNPPQEKALKLKKALYAGIIQRFQNKERMFKWYQQPIKSLL